MAAKNPKWPPEIINRALCGWDLLGDDVFWVYNGGHVYTALAQRRAGKNVMYTREHCI